MREMSVYLSVTLWYCIKTDKASVVIFSLMESQNTPVFENIQFIPKFERGHAINGLQLNA